MVGIVKSVTIARPHDLGKDSLFVHGAPVLKLCNGDITEIQVELQSGETILVPMVVMQVKYNDDNMKLYVKLELYNEGHN